MVAVRVSLLTVRLVGTGQASFVVVNVTIALSSLMPKSPQLPCTFHSYMVAGVRPVMVAVASSTVTVCHWPAATGIPMPTLSMCRSLSPALLPVEDVVDGAGVIDGLMVLPLFPALSLV